MRSMEKFLDAKYFRLLRFGPRYFRSELQQVPPSRPISVAASVYTGSIANCSTPAYLPLKLATRPEGHLAKSAIAAPTRLSHSVSSSWSPPPSPSKNPRMYMVFTCVKCETRAVKSFTKAAYEKGVVLVQCPGCQNRHVIADNLGWFGEQKNIEEVLREKGETVRRVTDSDLDFVSAESNAGHVMQEERPVR